MNTKKLNKGFTLIEVLISIVIIGIMSAVAIMSYKGYVAKSNQTATQQELAQVAQAYEVAALDGTFKVDAASYDFEDLQEMYEDVTGYELPFEQGELLFGNGKLTLIRRDVTAVYDFTTKTITIN